MTPSLYDADFVDWTAHMAELLRAGRFDELDIEHLAEEIEDLGKRDRKEVRCHLGRMLMHLIMESVQPEGDGPAWRAPIIDGRHEIWLNLEDSPSLRGHLETHLADTYVDAVKDAIYVLNL